MIRRSFIALAAGALASPALAQANRTERVRFDKGATAKVIKGRVKGYASVNYLVGVRAGQSLSFTLTTSNTSNYMNITGPADREAMFIGSAAGNEFATDADMGGDYEVDVYLMRNAARRNETADYTLTISVTG